MEKNTAGGVAEYSTPEKFFGDAFTSAVYQCEPAESYQRMLDYFHETLPDFARRFRQGSAEISQVTHLPMPENVEFQGHFLSDSLRCARLCEVLDVSLNYLLTDGKREKFGEGYLIDDAARMDIPGVMRKDYGDNLVWHSNDLYRNFRDIFAF